MSVHPQIAAALEALAKANLPPLETLSPEAARAQMDAMVKARGGAPAPIDRTEDRTAPGPGGDIPLRVYWPKTEGAAGPLGTLLYFHGGGHVIGNLDTHDLICRNLTAGAEAMTVSVDYRMGPEHRFPAAVEDCWAALEWLHENAASLGGDPARIAVGGDSAGGNLAAVTALMARDAGGPELRLQLLLYPVTDYGLSGESYERYATGYGLLTKAAMAWFQNHYLSTPAMAADWRASPIRAESLAGAAPALVIVAECDVLQDDGARYAEALAAAGVPTEHTLYPGMIHGFFGMAPDVDDATAAQKQAAEALKRAFQAPA